MKLFLTGLLMLAGTLNCQTAAMRAGVPHEVTAAELSDVFHIERTVTLQDRGSVLTVLPVVAVEEAGFFVVDPREFQVRQYDSLGTLLSYFGRPGSGPGEFTRLVGAVKLPTGEIVAADASGQLIRFSAQGREQRRVSTGLASLHNIALVNDSTIALAGRPLGGASGPFVHIWNLRRDRVSARFFQMPAHDPRLNGAYATGAVDVAIHGDTAAATLALSDTVYLFTLDGKPIEKLPVPSRGFRPVSQPLPDDPQSNPTALAAWGGSFSRISKVFWAPDGSLYVQWFDLRLAEPEWNLVHMRRANGGAVEVRNNPRLLAVSPFDSRLVFIHPQSSEPNVWAIGTPSSGF